MILASYDWRLSLHDMERRDHYFTILKNRIETLVKINGGRKVRMGPESVGIGPHADGMLPFAQ